MLYLPRDRTPSAVFYRATRVYGALTALLVLHGRTDYFDSIAAFSAGCFDRMDSQSDADKQTNPVVSPSLLQWEMKDVRNF